VPEDGTRFPALSVQHAGLLSKGPEDFRLNVVQKHNTCQIHQRYRPDLLSWRSTVDLPMVCISGYYNQNRNFRWEMKLDLTKNTGTLADFSPLPDKDPLQYPVDALLIYYLSLFRDALILHASAVSFGERGLAFTGCSGAGKSTIARFCQLAGARILHDDRILLRLIEDRIIAYRMPVYPGSLPLSMPLNSIYFINKSVSTYEIPQPLQSSFEKLACHIVQHPFHPDIIHRQIRNLEAIVRKVQTFDLGFPFNPEIGFFLAERSKACSPIIGNNPDQGRPQKGILS